MVGTGRLINKGTQISMVLFDLFRCENLKELTIKAQKNTKKTYLSLCALAFKAERIEQTCLTTGRNDTDKTD
jgi:hypothetical protein